MSYTRVNHGFLIEAHVLDNTSGTSYDISSTVKDIMIRKRYLEDTFPLFVFDIRTTTDMRDIIRDNDVSISTRIAIYNLDDENTSDGLDTNEVTEIAEFFNGTIRLYDKPYTTTASTDDEDSGSTETASSSVPMVNYRISGIPEDQLTLNETIMNRIYEQAEVVDAAINMLSEVNTNGTMYIQETDNKDLFDIYIPPVNLVPAIRSIDDNYKFYKDGAANLFIDDTGTYLYCPQSKDSYYRNIFEVNVLSSNATGDLENSGKVMLEDDNIKIIYRNLPGFATEAEIISHETGSDTVFYSYDDNFNLNIRHQNNEISYNKTRYLWNSDVLQSFEDQYMQTANIHTSLAIPLSNINPGVFNPLTIVRVVSSEYPEAEGDYYISEISFMFGSSDGSHFSDSVLLSCIKK